MKSISENMKNLLDPTPCFDSHISKHANKVASLTSYRAFEHTQVRAPPPAAEGRRPRLREARLQTPLTFQHYFYEYVCAELMQRPRQVLPYAVVSLALKGKDSSALPAAPLAPVRWVRGSGAGLICEEFKLRLNPCRV